MLNRATFSPRRSWFALDFCSLVPWEMFTLVLSVDSNSALRLPKLLKLLRLMKILKLMRASRVVNRIEQNLGMKNGIVRLLKVCVACENMCKLPSTIMGKLPSSCST
jgi:hypothetical protein